MQVLVELSEITSRGKEEGEEWEEPVLNSEGGREALAKLNSGGTPAGMYVCLSLCFVCLCVSMYVWYFQLCFICVLACMYHVCMCVSMLCISCVSSLLL